MLSERMMAQPRTETERIVVDECGGLNTLALSLILLMRSSGMPHYRAVAIARAVKFAAVEGNMPAITLGEMYRQDLKEMLAETDGLDAV
jgi:hypothetical protein